MCRLGHLLLTHSGSRVGGILWRWHLSSCRACSDLVSANKIIDNFVSGITAWPLPCELVAAAASAAELPYPRVAVSPRRRAASRAVGVALLVFLASGFTLAGRQLATEAAYAATAQAFTQSRTVHYLGKMLIGEQWYEFEVFAKAPDKRRFELKGNNITIVNGDRKLIVGTSSELRDYRLTRASGQFDVCSPQAIQSPDEWLRSEQDRNDDVVRRELKRGENGTRILVKEVRRKQEASYKRISRAVADPRNNRIISWKDEIWWAEEGKAHYYACVVDKVEYDLSLLDSLFNTKPPANVKVVDTYSGEGRYEHYRQLLNDLESKPTADRMAVADEWRRYKVQFDLSTLKPEQAETIRHQLERLSISELVKE